MKPGTLHKLFKPAHKGEAKIDHKEVDARAATFSKLREVFGSGDISVEEGRYVRLFVDGRLMMSDTNMEVITNTTFCEQARGEVLLAGLGIGLVLFEVARKAKVTAITVVEQSQDVIDLVEPVVRKALGQSAKKLTIVQGDIFEWSPPKGTRYDTIYFDIWPSASIDNLPEMARLHQRFARRKRSREAYMDSWRRPKLLRMRRELAQVGW